MSLTTTVEPVKRPAKPKRERIRTYVRGFDEAIGGGVPKGYVVLVGGSPGTMKSTFCFSLLYHNAVHHGRKGLYVTLEQARETLLEQMEEMGMDPTAAPGLTVLDLAAIRRNLSFLKAKGSWLALFKMYLKNLRASEGFDLVVVDSLDVLETLARFEDRRTELFHLFEWLKEFGATAFLISETTLSLQPGVKNPEETFLADGILNIAFHAMGEVDVQRRIRCVKMRSCKHDSSYYALLWNDGGGFEVTRAVSGVGQWK